MAKNIRFTLSADDNTGPGTASARKNIEGVAQGATMSAKATAAAMRNVPAQFTDIVTQLTGGQSPFTVLIQQGGQLKDMFGGIEPAAKALGGYLMGLVSPTALAAAGVAAIAVAYYQGSQEGTEFNKQLALTGNVAGLSTSQLMVMAAAQGKVTGSQHEAAEVLAVLVGTGKIAADQFGLIANAAIEMNRATGQPVKEIVADFVALGEEPVKASAKLNESHHYLTQAVYEQIAALVEQGDKLGAAALATTTYANASLGATKQITSNLGALQRSWEFVTTEARRAWDAMLGVGRAATGSEQLASLKKSLADREARGPINSMPETAVAFEKGNAGLRQQIALLDRLNSVQEESAKKVGQDKRDQQTAIDATAAIDKMEERAKGITAVNKALAEYHKQLDDIRKVNPTSEKLSAASIKEGEAQIRKEHQGSQAKPSEAPINASIEKLKSQSEQEARALKLNLNTIAADYDMGLTTARQYLDAQFVAKQNALQAELGLAQKQEELARGKRNVAAAERFKTDIARITDEINDNWVQHGNAVDKLTAKVSRAVEAYRASLNAAFDTRQQGIDDQLQGAGLGSRALEELQRMTTLRREVDKRQEELRVQHAKGSAHGGLDDDDYQQEVASLQQYYAARLAQEGDFNAKAKALRMDWSVGAKQAVATYLESAVDIAGQTNKMWTDALGQAGDTLLAFERTGKASVKSLADSVINDWLRMQNQLLLSKAIGGNGFVDNIASLLGFSSGSASTAGSVASSFAGADYSLGGVSSLGLKLAKNAKGGVYGASDLHAYANSVVSQPTMFAFAKGAGLMGEAGPEAIMPLARASDGTLGVATVGGTPSSSGTQGAGGFVYSPTNHISVDARSDQAAVMTGVQSMLSQHDKALFEKMKRLGVMRT